MYLEREEKASNGYYIVLALNLVVGLWNCGIALAGNSDVADILAVQLNWGDKADFNNTMISAAGVLGLTIGALTSKFVIECGRVRAILLANLVITVVTIPYIFAQSLWLFVLTKVIFGIAAAIIVNASSLYIAETTPPQHETVFGVLINCGIVNGILIIYLLGLILPEKTDPEAATDSFWRVSYCLPLLTVVITTPLWLFVFRTEPVKFLLAKVQLSGGHHSPSYEETLAVIKKNYNLPEREMQQ